MLGVGFGYGIRTGLMLLDGGSETPQEGVFWLGHQHTLPSLSPIFVQLGDIFTHDNARAHTARIVRTVLQGMRIKVMEWPPYSPDLNPIESIWTLRKAEVYRDYPYLETH